MVTHGLYEYHAIDTLPEVKFAQKNFKAELRSNPQLQQPPGSLSPCFNPAICCGLGANAFDWMSSRI